MINHSKLKHIVTDIQSKKVLVVGDIMLDKYVFGFVDRGILRKGAIADITVFNPEIVIDRANFKKPTQEADGIMYVIVGGEVILENGLQNHACPGKVVTRGVYA